MKLTPDSNNVKSVGVEYCIEGRNGTEDRTPQLI